MVSPVQYLRARTGIDIALPAREQSLAAVDNAMRRHGRPGTVAGAIPGNTEAIYDAVVGIDRVGDTDFDGTGRAPERLHAFELGKLVDCARALQSKAGVAPATSRALGEIATAAHAYQDLLVGKRQRIAKGTAGLGSRHTLVRGINGAVFEMTNSMSVAEVERFRKKTAMHLPAIERPARTSVVDGKTLYKIALGEGGFGKARIARDIMSDTYVAVKKVHPKLYVDEDIVLDTRSVHPSNFWQLKTEIDFGCVSDAVIAPIDECIVESKRAEQINRLAEDINTLKAGRDYAVARRIVQTPQMHELRAKIGVEMCKAAMHAVLDPRLTGLRTDHRSRYSFSQLGIVSVGDFLNHFNVIRFHLERSTEGAGMSAGAVELMMRHAACHDTAETYGASGQELIRLRELIGASRFAQKDFKLKCALYNQRFLNTIGRDMLSALTKLHAHPGGPIGHRDVKPDNMVFLQDADRRIHTKLIDIDQVEKQTTQRYMPGLGSRLFMPPEAFLPEYDDSISYDALKADAYAMGASLRLLAGFSLKDIDAIASMLLLESAAELNDTRKTSHHDSTLKDDLKRIKKRLKDLSLQGDNRIQKPLRVQAIMRAVPEAVTLKDIADLMLNSHPGERVLPSEVLRLPFFQKSDNFLPHDEFSAHVAAALRFMQVTDMEDVKRINEGLGAARANLKEVRRLAAHAALANRRQTPAPGEMSTLSKSETKKVNGAERALRWQSLLQRTLHTLAGGNSARNSIADRKLNYVRHFPLG
ncbi:MAG: hypothetical protein H7234_06115 [Herminiimonas sp.]|nr:hypothetical protein [Herminiimonas sp.]